VEPLKPLSIRHQPSFSGMKTIGAWSWPFSSIWLFSCRLLLPYLYGVVLRYSLNSILDNSVRLELSAVLMTLLDHQKNIKIHVTSTVYDSQSSCAMSLHEISVWDWKSIRSFYGLKLCSFVVIREKETVIIGTLHIYVSCTIFCEPGSSVYCLATGWTTGWLRFDPR
jgi:hypothetical protein